MKSCEGSRCSNRKAFLAAIRATRRYINKHTQNRKQHLFFPIFLSALCTPISLPLFLRSVLWYTVRISLCVYIYIRIRVYVFSVVHLRQPEYHHSSRFHNSLSGSSYFLEKENVRESWTLRVCKHRLSTSLLLWYLSVVCSSLFHLSRSSPPITIARGFSPLIFCHWILDAKTDPHLTSSRRERRKTRWTIFTPVAIS